MSFHQSWEHCGSHSSPSLGGLWNKYSSGNHDMQQVSLFFCVLFVNRMKKVSLFYLLVKLSHGRVCHLVVVIGYCVLVGYRPSFENLVKYGRTDAHKL